MKELRFHKISPEVQMPRYSTGNSACFDIYAYLYNPVELYPGSVVEIPTGLIPVIPEGYSIRIHPRSGLAFKNNISLVNAEGIIDSDYRNEIRIKLWMLDDLYDPTQKAYLIEPGERIAQGELVKDMRVLIGEELHRPTLVSGRNGGFGSTGKF